MTETLQNLTNLQYIDNRIDEIKQLHGDLPEEIEDIETDILRADSRLKKLREEEKALMIEFDTLQADIARSKELVAKYEDQQLSVRNNREYDALTKEMESQNKRIDDSLFRLDSIRDRQQTIGPDVDHEADRLADIKHVFGHKKSELDELVASTSEEMTKLEVIRKDIEADVDATLLIQYTRIREGSKNKLAVVPMERGSAMGMLLPPQVQVEVRRKNKLIFDEHSGRIVVDKTFFVEADKRFKL
jgi:predicted  nucleic acid-binding Zn-ribbon protein